MTNSYEALRDALIEAQEIGRQCDAISNDSFSNLPDSVRKALYEISNAAQRIENSAGSLISEDVNIDLEEIHIIES